MRPLQAGWWPDHIGGLQGAEPGERLTGAVMPCVQQYCEVEHMLGMRLDGLVVDLVVIERSAESRVLRVAGRRLAMALGRTLRGEGKALPRHGDARPKQNDGKQERNDPGWHGATSVQGGGVRLTEGASVRQRWRKQARTMAARNISSCVPFTFRVARSTIIRMKRLTGRSWTDGPVAPNAFERIGRTAASVLLAIGVAALVGWVVVELYVAAVTLD